MSQILNLLLWAALTAGFGSSPEMPQKQMMQEPNNANQVSQSEQQKKVLGKDYNVAKKALDKAVAEKDKETVRLALKGFSLEIKQDAVRAITGFGDKSFVPDLIATLENNQAVMSGGTETEVLQQELNENIVNALEHLTGLQFIFSEKVSAQDIQRIIKTSREWWEQNKDN